MVVYATASSNIYIGVQCTNLTLFFISVSALEWSKYCTTSSLPYSVALRSPVHPAYTWSISTITACSHSYICTCILWKFIKTNLVLIIDHGTILNQDFHNLKMIFVACSTQWRGSKVIILYSDIHTTCNEMLPWSIIVTWKWQFSA